MGKYRVEIVHVVEFRDRFEVEVDTEEAAVAQARGAFVEKPEQSMLLDVYAAEVEPLPSESDPAGGPVTPVEFEERTDSRRVPPPHATGFASHHQMRFVLEALDEVLDSRWDDEMDAFEANGCPEEHLFRSIEFLRLWAFRAQGELRRRKS